MIVTVSNDLAAFANVWPLLDQPGPHRAYAFQARDVLEVWLETIGAARGTLPFFVRVSHPDGTPVMLLPLGLERHYGLRFLGFLDGGVSDYNAPIMFPGSEDIDAAAIGALWDGILAKLPACDVVILEKMPANVGEIKNSLQVLAPALEPRSGHLIHLDPPNHPASKPVRFSDAARKRRKLASLGEVRFVVSQTKPETTRAFETMVRQKTRRYIETRGVDGFERPGYRAYYRKMTERFSASGQVKATALFSGDTPIATGWGILTRDRFYDLMPAFEAGEWARYSPGILHLESLIAWAHSQGITTYDLGVGDEPYKFRVANARLPLFKGQYARTAAGSVFLSLLALRRKLAAGPVGEAWRAYKAWRFSKTH